MLKISRAVLKWSTSIIIGSTFWGLNLLYPSTARAWFDVCNKSGDKAFVAFAYLEIDAAESDIFGNTKVYQKNAQRVTGYYANGGDSVWRGSGSDKSYCINPSVEFEFKGSSTYSEGEYQENGGQMVIFKPVRPSRQAYTLNLTN
ncbi:hypothetical protein [Microcoleus sp. POL10_C6]|uniref:hypothetical protein n=1 Tax=Microcoleus sp. POL10_C6 TaxID=2818852 RepID=UPI002FD63880